VPNRRSRTTNQKTRTLPSPLAFLSITLNALMAISFFADWFGEATKRIDGADFTSFYTGWSMVHSGMGAQLYDIAAQTRVQTSIVHGTFPNGVLVFCAPPFVALLFSPLAALPLNWARFVFALMNIGMATILMRQVRHLMPGISRKQFQRFTLFVVSLSPLWATITGGTLSIFVATGVAGMIASLRNERTTQAGLWIGLIALKPQYLPFILVFLLSRRLWRTIATSTAVGIGLFLISLPLGLSRWFEFTKLLQKMGTVTVDYGVNAHSMWNVRALITRLVRGHSLSLGPKVAYLGPQPVIIGIITTALLIATLGVLYKTHKRDLSTHATALVVLSGIFTLHGHHHDTIMMVIPFAIIITGMKQRLTQPQFAKQSALLYLSSLVIAVAAFSAGSPLLFLGPALFAAISIWHLRQKPMNAQT
jgi:hypothetical protein